MTRISISLRVLIVLSVSFSSLLRIYVHAQGREIRFEHLTTRQGLSNNSAVCVFQDRLGFMWIGTQDGLNRFDRYQFTTFKNDPADSTTLPDNFIVTIVEDSSGSLWIGTVAKRPLNRLDPINETFSHGDRDSVDLRHARVSGLPAFYEDPTGVQWTARMGEGVTRFDRRTRKTTVFKHDPSNPASLIDNRVYSIIGDRSGTIWIGTREGLERFDPNTETFVHYRHDEKNSLSLSDNWVWPILEDRSGVLWVGTFGGGLNRFDRVNGTFTHYRHDDSNPRSISDERIYSLCQDVCGRIWVGTSDHGIDHFNPEMKFSASYRNNPKDPASLTDNRVWSICVDRTGAAWIGTEVGVDRLNRSSSKFEHFRHDPSNPRSLGENRVQCILEDEAGVLWMGTWSNGLDRFDRASGQFTHFRHDPSNSKSLSDNRVCALCEDHLGEFWVGTYGGGLNHFNRKTGTFTTYAHSDSVATSLGAAGVLALCEDHEGVLWVGTLGGGLDRFNREQGTFTHYRHDVSNPGSLSDSMVVYICEDRRGTLWVGTTGGLNRLDRETGTFTHYRQKDGLPNDVIFGILEDDQGNLWMSTNKGLSRFHPENRAFRNYGYDDGLQEDEFNAGAFAKDHRTGEMLFGGINGFNLFHPDSVRDDAVAPPVVIRSFIRYTTESIEGKPIEDRQIAAKQHIVLAYQENVLTFSFAALSYETPAKNEFAFRLVGFRNDWIRLGTERQTTFTNLDPGKYTLEVKASNNDRVWNERATALAITITPPWWRTTTAYVLYALLFLSGGFGTDRFMRRRLVRTGENRRRVRELDEARQLQLSMLPKDVPQVGHLEIAVLMKTATEVGGDYYDFHLSDDGTVTIVLGDATGHGLNAGMLVTAVKSAFKSSDHNMHLPEFFSKTSLVLRGMNFRRLYMAIVALRIREYRVSVAAAGMPPLLIYHAESGSVEELLIKGMPLGSVAAFPYQTEEFILAPGDVIVLMSDGFPERFNEQGEILDYQRARQELEFAGSLAPEAIIQHLVKVAEKWGEKRPQDDDMTFVVVKAKERAG